jgi:hypothetical protein
MTQSKLISKLAAERNGAEMMEVKLGEHAPTHVTDYSENERA